MSSQSAVTRSHDKWHKLGLKSPEGTRTWEKEMNPGCRESYCFLVECFGKERGACSDLKSYILEVSFGLHGKERGLNTESLFSILT